MRIIEGFDFFPLTFDDKGKLESGQELDALIERAVAAPATDAVFIAHGFRNDAADATWLYTAFLKTFRGQLARPEFSAVAGRRFVVAGVYWPSKPFRESGGAGSEQTRGLQDDAHAIAGLKAQLEDVKKDFASPAQRPKLEKAITLLPTLEGNPKAQDEFVTLVLSLFDHSAADETEGLSRIRRRSGSELLARLGPAAAASGTRGIGDLFGSIAGGVGQFLNLTKWYVMKDRSAAVGETGVAAAARALHKSRPDIRIHMVGHSLGGRLMAGCAKALSKAPELKLDSLMLLEAAFSHFGFSPDNGHGEAGFFRDVVVKQVVKGPFISTFSAEDTVVAQAYSIMSRLAGDNTREIGDASDEFGGIGRNGPLKTPEVANFPLKAPSTPDEYKAGVINNLDGSGGPIKDHNDVTNDAVTYVFASAVART